jgi:regulator of protease activity HflC (stomatin/prohibitin superfamily)
MLEFLSFPVVVIGLLVLYLLNSIKILPEYERGVIFRLGGSCRRLKGRDLRWSFFRSTG